MQRAEHELAQGMAAIFVAAAARTLQREHGWERAAAVAFGERLLVVSNEIAVEVAAELRGRSATAGSTASITAAAEPPTG